MKDNHPTAASLCDSCFAPGQCCKHIRLYGGKGPQGQALWRLDKPIAEQLELSRPHEANDGLPSYPIPFKIGKILSDFIALDGHSWGAIEFTCPNLLPSGRCGDYDNRPWLCRHFSPASGNICVHYQAAEGFDEVDIVRLAKEVG